MGDFAAYGMEDVFMQSPPMGDQEGGVGPMRTLKNNGKRANRNSDKGKLVNIQARLEALKAPQFQPALSPLAVPTQYAPVSPFKTSYVNPGFGNPPHALATAAPVAPPQHVEIHQSSAKDRLLAMSQCLRVMQDKRAELTEREVKLRKESDILDGQVAHLVNQFREHYVPKQDSLTVSLA